MQKMGGYKDAKLASLKCEVHLGNITSAKIEKMIYIIRGQKVILDSDLAQLYGVETGALNRQIKRNIERFPSDFMFQLSQTELKKLRATDPVLNAATKSRKYPPYAFTEYGIAALSGVLNSKIAIKVNTSIIRAFVEMRKLLTEDQILLQKINELKQRSNKLFQIVFERLDDIKVNTPLLPIKRKKIGLNIK